MVEQHPRACVALLLLPYSTPPGQIPNPAKDVQRLLLSMGVVTIKQECGVGNPSTRRRGDQVTFQSSLGPEGPPCFVCTRLGLAVVGPTWYWRLLPIHRGPGTSGPRGTHLLAHLSQLPQPCDSPALGAKAAQGRGM